MECFETLFGNPPTGRNMPTPGGRITPTRDNHGGEQPDVDPVQVVVNVA